MVTIEVCVGSSCYLRGAPKVIDRFQSLIATADSGEVVLKGSFCMERCGDGVSVRINDRVFAGVHPDDVPSLFDQHVRPLLGSDAAPTVGEGRQ